MNKFSRLPVSENFVDGSCEIGCVRYSLMVAGFDFLASDVDVNAGSLTSSTVSQHLNEVSGSRLQRKVPCNPLQKTRLRVFNNNGFIAW